jgi:hypothetical protein
MDKVNATPRLYGPTELGLNDGEEFIIVKKSNPAYMLRATNPGWLRTVDITACHGDAHWASKAYELRPSYHTAHKNDLIEGNHAIVWNSSLGQRRKIAKTQSLFYFLNGLCGRCTADYTFHLGQTDKNLRLRVENLESAGNSHGPFIDWELVKDFELRKYDKTSKTIHPEPVDFDCHAHARNFDEMHKLSMAYGQAVAQVAKQLLGPTPLSGFILHTCFDAGRFASGSSSWELDAVPREKDLYLAKAIKALGLAGHACSNLSNGFAAIWLQDQAQVDAFKAAYKEPQKLVAAISAKELLDDPRFELSLIAPAQSKSAAPKRKP